MSAGYCSELGQNEHGEIERRQQNDNDVGRKTIDHDHATFFGDGSGVCREEADIIPMSIQACSPSSEKQRGARPVSETTLAFATSSIFLLWFVQRLMWREGLKW